ncbi:PIG-L family deacetylase [bacterium]|nr:PIG-L family deacetylase [bacterium]
MNGGRIRRAVAAAVEGAARLLSRPLPEADLAAPAVVFAPHQDDETLGCGPLVALKRARGVPVTVVFLTDGRTSHARFLDADELAGRRRDEALAACRTLGVPEDAVHFLEFRDGELTAAVSAAAARVATLLRGLTGHLLLVPYAGDTTADHRATREVVLRALAALEGARTHVLLEYPVWFWHHWPWVCPPVARRLHKPAAVAAGLVAAACRLRDLRWQVDVAAVLPAKRRALDCHVTQMQRPTGQPGWPVLADVAGGAWLARFFTGREFVQRRVVRTGGAGRR